MNDDGIDADGEDRITATNVRLPVELAAQVSRRARELGYNSGEFIIVALEEALEAETLASHLHPGGTIGGGRFKARGVGATARLKAGETTPLSFSLFKSDLDEMDALAEEYHARSRTHLVTAAFHAFFAAHPDDPSQ